MDVTTPLSANPEGPEGAEVTVSSGDPPMPPPLAGSAGPPAPAAPGGSAPSRVRGGVSLSSAVTGAVVAGAAMVLFTLLARAIGTYADFKPPLLPVGGTRRAGFTAAAVSATGLFIAFLWGGYAGARMARAKGWLQGLLVAACAVVLGAIGLGIAALLRPGPGLDLAFRLPAGYPRIHLLLPHSVVAAAALLIVLLGATIGGMLGGAWHGRLERRALVREQERQEARETFRDLREALSAPEAAEQPVAGPTLGPPPRPGTLDARITG